MICLRDLFQQEWKGSGMTTTRRQLPNARQALWVVVRHTEVCDQLSDKRGTRRSLEHVKRSQFGSKQNQSRQDHLDPGPGRSVKVLVANTCRISVDLGLLSASPGPPFHGRPAVLLDRWPFQNGPPDLNAQALTAKIRSAQYILGVNYCTTILTTVEVGCVSYRAVAL